MNPKFIRTNYPTRVLTLSSVVRMSFETEETLRQRRIAFDLKMVQKSLEALRKEGFINE